MLLTVQVISNSSVVLLDENVAWCNMPMERSWLHIRSSSVHLYTAIDRAVLTSVPTPTTSLTSVYSISACWIGNSPATENWRGRNPHKQGDSTGWFLESSCSLYISLNLVNPGNSEFFYYWYFANIGFHIFTGY